MFDLKNQHDSRTTALLEAARLCGSQKNLGLKLKVKQSTINKWINDPEITIPYDLVLLIEKFTKISVTRLAPAHKEVNSYLQERAVANLSLLDIHKSTIITSGSLSLPFLQPKGCIITGTDGVLISGLATLNLCVASTVPALVLDLIAIIKKYQSLDDIINKLLISERIAISLRLAQIIGSRQGQKNNQQIIDRTDNFVANISHFSKNTYIRGKQVYLSHNEQLIDAINNKQMKIATAVRLVKTVK